MKPIHEPKNIDAKLTTAELAAHYHVTPRCIQNWRNDRKIPFVRISARCIRYDLAAVEAALRNKISF